MNKIKSQSGLATMIALIMVGMLTLIGLAALTTSDDEVQIAANQLQEYRAFYAAESGLDIATSIIQTAYDSTGKPPEESPSGNFEMNKCFVTFETSDIGPVVEKVLKSGVFAGLHASVRTFTLVSTAINEIEKAKIQITQDFQPMQIPIYQFAVFYENDLQATPKPNMALNGRVHSNGNIHLQAFTQLRIDSYLTSAGSIYHGLIHGQYAGTATADVYIKDRVGLYQSMNQGGTWLDATHPDWYNQAGALWGGKVQDQAFGIKRLNLPITDVNNPYSMLEPALGNDDSYENIATIKFKNQTAFRDLGGGIWLDVTVDMIDDSVIVFNDDQFYDDREDVWVDVMELDMAKLSSKGYWPTNGVLYFYDKPLGGHWPALRISNGHELFAPLTIASYNPVYTVGSYNDTLKKPAAILTDALTILSDNWDDTLSDLPKNQRVANSTNINVCFITGDVAPSAGSYGGGIENLPRFLEYWDPAVLTLRGSFICLWRSKQATSEWSINCYEPPVRDWAFDMDLKNPANHPPATPMIDYFQSVGWKQKFVGL